MKYQEGLNCSVEEFRNQFNTMIQSLFANALKVEGETVIIPTDRELDFKLKYDINEEDCAFGFKISWAKELAEDD